MSEKRTVTFDENELREAINLETGKISWEELQRHFARGVVVVISNELDLLEVAGKFVEDDKGTIEKWTQQKNISRALDEDAIRWEKNKSDFWACVIAPWVLVQEITNE